MRFEDIPFDATIYPTKMVLRHKRDSCAVSLGWKGRLCVIGNFAKEMLLCLFSPTAHERSLKILLVLSLIFSLIVSGIDIRGAFLYPEINRPVYISLPPALAEGQGGPLRCWRFKRTLYGLVDSPRAFMSKGLDWVCPTYESLFSGCLFKH